MRILMLHNDYLQVGGERLSVEAEVRGLTDSGHDVRQLVQHNDRLTTGGRLSNARAIIRPPRRESIGDRITSVIHGFRPDVVHCQNLFPLLGAAAIRALEEAGVPYVRHIRNYRLRCLSADLRREGRPCQDCRSAAAGVPGVLHRCYKSSHVASAGAAVYANLERHASRRYPPDAYILVSTSMIAKLSTVLDLRAKIHVKPNSVPVDACHPGGEQFLFAGRLTDEKGWPLIAELARELPGQRFVIVGDGPGAARLASLIDSIANLEWVREMENDQLRRAMAKSRAVLVPSTWEEPFGRVAAESLGVGTPCLVSARGGLPDIVSELPPHLVVADGSSSTWVAAIECISKMSSNDYQTLRRRCHGVAADTFSSEATTAQLVAIYDSILASTERRQRR